MPRLLCLVLASLTLLATQAHGATIDKLNVPKKYVSINEGSDAGFQKKAKVCFYEGTVKVGCGTVRTVKPASATVKIKSAKTLAKLKVGLEARLEVVGVPITALPVPLEGAPEPGLAPNYFQYSLSGSFASPVSHNNLAYETPQGQPVDSMWSKDGGTPVSAAALIVEAGFGIGSYTLATGFRLRPETFYQSKRIASDYDDKDADANGEFEQYAETSTQGSNSLGVYLDFYYLHYQWGVAGLRIGSGLDFDSSTVKFKMEQKDDNSPDSSNLLYAGTSKLTAIALRNNMILDLSFGSFGFLLGTTISVPLSQSQKFSLDSSEDPFVSNLQELTPDEDLKKSLNHKAAFGVELIGGFRYIY